MNEKIKIALSYILCAVLGAGVSGTVSGLTVRSSANKRIADLEEQTLTMRREHQEIRNTNTELKQAAERDDVIKQQLRDTITAQSRAIEEANKYLNDTIESNNEAGRYNREALDIVTGIIEGHIQAREK